MDRSVHVTNVRLKVCPTPNWSNAIRYTHLQQGRTIPCSTHSETWVDLVEQVTCDAVRYAYLRACLLSRRDGVPATAEKSRAIGDGAVARWRNSTAGVACTVTGSNDDPRNGVRDVVNATLWRQAKGATVDPDGRKKVVAGEGNTQLVAGGERCTIRNIVSFCALQGS